MSNNTNDNTTNTNKNDNYELQGDETIESDFDEDIDKLNTKDDLEITFKSKQNISEALVDESEIETVAPNDSLQANEMETEILSKSNKSSCRDDNTIKSITKDPKANEDLNVSVESLEKKISRNVILIFDFINYPVGAVPVY